MGYGLDFVIIKVMWINITATDIALPHDLIIILVTEYLLDHIRMFSL